MSGLFDKFAYALTSAKCPKCGSSSVEVRRVDRRLEQTDGFQGKAYSCRSCGFEWAEPSAPVV